MSQRSVANEDRPEEIIDGSDETRADKSEKYLSRYAPSLAWAKPGKYRTGQASGSSIPSGELKLRWQRSFARAKDVNVIAAGNNEALAVEIPVGQGRIVAIADPTMVSNGALRRSDNAVWLVTLAAGWGEGKILFDEYHHGFGEKRGTGELIRAFLVTPWGWWFCNSPPPACSTYSSIGAASVGSQNRRHRRARARSNWSMHAPVFFRRRRAGTGGAIDRRRTGTKPDQGAAQDFRVNRLDRTP